jgi:uncharacterized protein YbaA (DUF1428 family)
MHGSQAIITGVAGHPALDGAFSGLDIIKNNNQGGFMSYVDGFVLPVPKKNLQTYRRIAQKAGKVWREHGALEYMECVADDVKPGKLTSFPQSVKLKPGETVVFAYIVYKSRAHRDRVNAKVMKDPRLANMMDPKAMPFDAKRMFWGGFKTLVEAE